MPFSVSKLFWIFPRRDQISWSPNTPSCSPFFIENNYCFTLFQQEYICNGEWLLTGLPVTRNVDNYGNQVDPSNSYVDLTYLVVIRRMPLYYIFNLFFPCLVITTTAILVFCLPPESGEKVNLGVTVLLALTVFLLLVAQSVPSQSVTVPLAG